MKKYLCIDDMLDAMEYVKEAGWDYFKLEKDKFGFYIIACGKDQNNEIKEVKIAHIADHTKEEFIPKYYSALYPQELSEKPAGYFPMMEY